MCEQLVIFTASLIHSILLLVPVRAIVNHESFSRRIHHGYDERYASTELIVCWIILYDDDDADELLLLGQALGGIFAAVANIVSIFLAADILTSAFLYFLVGSLSLFVSLVFTIYLPKSVFYKFYLGEKGSPFRWVENSPPEAMLTPRANVRVYFWEVLKKVCNFCNEKSFLPSYVISCD